MNDVNDEHEQKDQEGPKVDVYGEKSKFDKVMLVVKAIFHIIANIIATIILFIFQIFLMIGKGIYTMMEKAFENENKPKNTNWNKKTYHKKTNRGKSKWKKRK